MAERDQERRPAPGRAAAATEERLEARPRPLPRGPEARPRPLPRGPEAPRRPRPEGPAAVTPPARATAAGLAAQLRDREALRRAVLLHEILGPPVALRDGVE